MNDLQKVELGILKEYVILCESLNLKYYLVCGSALGAVKYGGFIPWDDDIDVAMPRRDYEVFLDCASKLLPEWCFVQNYRTNKEFHLIGTKLRDSRTTFVEYSCENLNINHCVFIDVFPLDSYLPQKDQQKKFAKMQKRIEAIRRVRLNYRRFTSREIFSLRNNYYYILYKLFGLYKNTVFYIAQYESFISSGNSDESDIICNHANSIDKRDYSPKWHYGNGVSVEFEGLVVRIPENYDAYLTQKYGEWRADLPSEEQKGHHYYVLCDLDKPYTSYFEYKNNGQAKFIGKINTSIYR